MAVQDSNVKLRISMKSSMREIAVLAFLTKGDSYGYEIAASIGIEISESSLYPILRRLEEQGHLRSYSQTHEARLRKYYSITETGTKQLNLLAEDWKNVKSEIEAILLQIKENLYEI